MQAKNESMAVHACRLCLYFMPLRWHPPVYEHCAQNEALYNSGLFRATGIKRSYCWQCILTELRGECPSLIARGSAFLVFHSAQHGSPKTELPVTDPGGSAMPGEILKCLTRSLVLTAHLNGHRNMT